MNCDNGHTIRAVLDGRGSYVCKCGEMFVSAAQAAFAPLAPPAPLLGIITHLPRCQCVDCARLRERSYR